MSSSCFQTCAIPLPSFAPSINLYLTVAPAHFGFNRGELLLLPPAARRRPPTLPLEVFFSDPEHLLGLLKLPHPPPLEPDHHSAVTPSPCLAPIRRMPASCSGEPRCRMCPKMEPPLPPLRSGTKMPKKGGLEPCSGEPPPPTVKHRRRPPVLARAGRVGPRAALGRAGRLLATPGRWPGALLGQVWAVCMVGSSRPAVNRRPRLGLIEKDELFSY